MVHVIPSISLFILLFCVTLSTVYILGRYFAASPAHHKRVSHRRCSFPPRYPQKSLLLGLDVLRDIILAVRSRRYLKTIQLSYQQYGDTFSKYILFSSIICTIEPDNIKTVLSTSFKDYGITSVRKDAFRPFLGQNILIADGTEWTHARAMLRPSFSKTNHGDLKMFEVHVNDLLIAIRRRGPAVDLKDLFLGLTTDVTTHSMYGESVYSLKSGALSGIMEAFHDAQYGCENRARWGRLAMFVPQSKFYRSVRILQRYMEQHVRRGLQYRKAQESASIGKTEGRYVFLHELAEVIQDKSRLRDELLTILVAGRDTTASLLCSLFLTIANRPDVWLQLRAEVEHLNGEKPTFEQLRQMKYVKNCLNESESPPLLVTTSDPILVLNWAELGTLTNAQALRLYPPLPHNARVAVQDTILPTGGGTDGHAPIFVPAGTKIEFHASALHRRKDLWGEDAEDYRPERWENDITSWHFLAFSGGPRQCIGQQFGFTVALYTTVRLIQEFESLESRDPEPWTEHLGVVCFPLNGVKVSMTTDRQRETL